MTRVQLNPDGLAPVLDRYQLVGMISSGGMGTVSLGRLAGVGGFQRLVAVKQLHPHLAREEEFVEMFLDEARLAASIHHQNVVSILEVGTSESGYYLVMEYIEGASLAEVEYRCSLRARRMPQPMMVRVLLDTLAGLHAAHELKDDYGQPIGLVHRDCTPQNILLGLDGCTKITDFGIARASARLASTREGAFKGKLSFMAPEQTQGENIDRRADLFSVGVMLWESMVDRRLFKASSEAQTLNNLLNMPVPSLRDLDPKVHPQLDAVCAKALARDPAARFQTAEEMAEALERAARAATQAGSEPVATVRELAAFVGEVLGDEITAQRESVRTWLTKSENTAAVISSSRPSAKRPALAPAPLSEGPPSTDRNWLGGDATPPPRPTERGWPPSRTSASGVHAVPPPADSQEEQTLVHVDTPDPVLDVREYPVVPDELDTAPRTRQSLGLERRWRWPVIGASVAVLGVGGALVLVSALLWDDGQQGAPTDGSTTARTTERSDEPGASGHTTAAVLPTTATPAPSATTAAGTTTAASDTSAPATPTKLALPSAPTAATTYGSRPKEPATATAQAPGTARPKTTAVPTGGDDDLTNPYRK